MALLDAETAKLETKVIPGEVVFRLSDTYGFPVDLTADVARERGLSIDQAGYDAAMAAQRDRAKSASKFGASLRDSVKLSGRTDFSGYERLTGAARVTALIFDGAVVDILRVGQEGQVVLDQTPFYAESGGQMGALRGSRHAENRLLVRACRGARGWGLTRRRRGRRERGR
jgi:alanyl-tRNA synthetase